MSLLDYMPYVYSIAYKYKSTAYVNDERLEDVVGAGMLGLVIAGNKHEASDGKHSLFSFIRMFVRAEIQNMLWTDVKKRTPRNKLPTLLGSFSSGKDSHLLHYMTEHYDDDLLTEEILDSLKGMERTFFELVLEYGHKEASRMMVMITGKTRQSIHTDCTRLRAKVRRMYESN